MLSQAVPVEMRGGEESKSRKRIAPFKCSCCPWEKELRSSQRARSLGRERERDAGHNQQSLPHVRQLGAATVSHRSWARSPTPTVTLFRGSCCPLTVQVSVIPLSLHSKGIHIKNFPFWVEQIFHFRNSTSLVVRFEKVTLSRNDPGQTVLFISRFQVGAVSKDLSMSPCGWHPLQSVFCPNAHEQVDHWRGNAKSSQLKRLSASLVIRRKKMKHRTRFSFTAFNV